MAGNPTARKNVTRERKLAEAEARKPKFTGGPAGQKKESAEDKIMKKKKITDKEAVQVMKKTSKARILKQDQKDATKDNRPGISANNKFLT